MEKKLRKIVSVLLLVCMVIGCAPAVYGAETDAQKEEATTKAEQNDSGVIDENSSNMEGTETDNVADITDSNPTGNDEVEITDGMEPTTGQDTEEPAELSEASEANETAGDVSGIGVGDANQQPEAGTLSDNAVNYVYIESPYLQTPNTQRLVFAFEKEIEGVDAVMLSVMDEAGNEEELPLSEHVDGLYLFEKEYTGEAFTGTYSVSGLKIYTADSEEFLSAADMGIEAEFGVNEEYSGIEKLQPIEEDMEDASPVGASVVTINEDGTTEAQDSIEDALKAVSADMETNAISTYSANGVSRSARSGNIVVALDPGHDSTHAGASGNGLREEVLTLKIANYCKEELEQYSGVSVYMTRTNASCPYPGGNSGADIAKRVEAAARAGAQIFVSFHLNSSTSSAANGAEIIVPNRNWKPGVGAEGEALAREILDELVALGLHERSIYSKDTTVNERYEDGSLSDYFAVQIYSKEHGIPGIIVEHAFISNSSDANNFLKTEAGLKKLGVADATGIAQYLGLSKGHWETDAQGNKYYYVGNEKVTGVYKIGGDFYYFDPNSGIMHTGWREDGEDTYYYGKDGKLCFGVEQINGEWYYFKETNGMMYTGWREDGEYTYYYKDDGKLCFGVEEIDGEWYYFKENNGIMHTGWREDGESTYYYGEDGRLSSGVEQIEGKWYYFEESNGVMHIGWREDDEGTYYYGKDGELCFGVQQIDGEWYYFKENNGIMYTGWRKDGEDTYYYDTDGKLCFGDKEIDGEKYYFRENNAIMYIGWRENGKSIYYYDEEGRLVKGVYQIGKYWYYFDEKTGARHTGWREDGKDYYYYNSEGELLLGEQKIGEYWYYFDKNNAIMYTGWRHADGNTYYYDDEGHLSFGSKIIDGKEYYFNPNTGALVDDKSELMSIEGENGVTVKQMVNFYNQKSPIAYPASELKKGGAATIEEFAQIFYEEASAEGIKVEVAWCQSMHETGWLKFGGQVSIGQFNFAGLGATDGGAKGADFSGYGTNAVRMGVRAQIQHLKAYADPNITEATLKYACVDPRFKYVSPKGCAKYVEYLGQKENPDGKGWATSEGYGYRIVELVEKLKKCSP